MRPWILPGLMVGITITLGACSTSRLPQQSGGGGDDVYGSKAVATEQVIYQVNSTPRSNQYDDNRYNDDSYVSSDYNDDMSYSTRLYKFYYYTPWRTYYDPYYDYWFGGSSYNSWGYGPSFGLSFGFGSPFYGSWGYNNYWNYYGSPYGSPYWGPYSYYNPYSPYWGWGGGYYGNGWGGGYWGGNWGGGNYNANYRGRPSRGGDNSANMTGGMNSGMPSNVGRTSTVRMDGNGNVMSGGRGTRSGGSGTTMYVPDRSTNGTANPNAGNGRPSRDNFNPNTRPTRPTEGSPMLPDRSSIPQRPVNSGYNGRPTRDNYRPTRSEQPQPQQQQPRYEPRPSYTPPPSSSGSGNGGGRSGGGGGGGGRPTRSGGG